MNSNRAAVAYVERTDGRLLVMWNQRYGGWCFPGGMVEEGETLFQAMSRELEEETGLKCVRAKPLYSAPHHDPVLGDRASHVYVFHAYINRNEAKERELGSPVTWFTREQILKWGCFKAFYETMFERIGETDANGNWVQRVACGLEKFEENPGSRDGMEEG